MKTYKVTVRPSWANSKDQYDGTLDETKFVKFSDEFTIFDAYDMMIVYQSRHSMSTDIVVEEVAGQ